TCRPCEEKCGSDKPYCVSENPDDEYSRYFCAATESCPDGFEFAMNGQCLPKSGSPCPDELKTKDICITQKMGDYSEAALYYCDRYGEVSISERSDAECKEVDVSTYGTALKTIFVLVDQHSDAPQFPACGKSGVSTECIYTSDNKDAISGYACTKATDGTLVTIDLLERGIYLKTCSENQYCGYSEDIEMHTCFDLEADPEVPEP
ncbi:MAG: hypothetical protein II180_13785, partial [Proteobacteria bacterium]|nr:hypothetical protein [Pseudomonadota bacterium]